MAKKKYEPPVPADMMPQHIAIIMDGNGRWAKKRGMPRTYGHVQGARNFRKLLRYAREIGVKYISFYAFSTENWKRPDDEVHALMNLMRKYLKEAYDYFDDRVRVVLLGDREDFEADLRQQFTDIEKDTGEFEKMTAGIAANYGSRHEITGAARQLAQLVKEGKLEPEDITEELLSDHLYTKGMPDVDLMIRPGGEQRLSNFLLWQCAYAEFYFCDTLWPDFDSKELDKAIVEFARRTRRFGGL
ncbi:MAG: di-trans,poly-cis-decaprenylcistransferase [Oscillospiraceae bacterium]|nr:di-trans,poly-cis-decaprenylcistransferase [Oscillospiraceae bacterium]